MCLTLLVPLAPLLAQEKSAGTRPVWKGFDELNKPFWQEQKTETAQSMKIMGMEVTQKQAQTFIVKWTPRRKGGNSWEVDYEIVGVKMDIEISGNKISYDSTAEDNVVSPLADFFKALLSCKVTLKVESHAIDGLKVTSADGLDALIAKAAGDNAQMKSLLEQTLNLETFSQSLATSVGPFPLNDEEFKKGSWTRTSVMNMGYIGRYDNKMTYTPDTRDKTRVNIKATMKYLPPRRVDPDAPFKIIKGNLASEKAEGKAIIDIKAGRVVESTMEMHIKGTLTIDIAGMETEVELVQSQVNSVRTLDRDPIKKR
jgi:hypothetical protein